MDASRRPDMAGDRAAASADEVRPSPWALIVFVAAASALVGLGLHRVWTEYQVFEVGSRLRAESARHQALVDDQRRLSLEASALEHSLDVEGWAREHLGMRTPEDRQVVVVRRPPDVRAPAPAPNPAPNPAVEP